MEKAKLVPKVRFSGYTDAWEEHKLGEFGSVAMCRRIFKHQTANSGEIPFYKIGTFGGIPDAFISKELFEEYKTKYPYPQNGDILISASGSIGRTVEFMGENEYFQDSNIVWLKHSDDIMNPFLRHLYDVVEWAGIEGSTIKRLYNDNILKTDAAIPSVEEQARIAEIFDDIDGFTILHQLRLEKLLDYKFALAEKMFPSVGQQPELRIINEGLWEEVTIADIGDYFSTDTLSYADLTEDGKYKCLLYGDLYTKYNEKIIGVKSRTNKMVTKLAKNDILFPTSTTVDALSLIAPSCVCEDDVYTGGDLFGISPKVGISGTFVSYYINNKHSIKNSFAKNAQGLTIVHIHYDNIKNERIMIPDYREQVAIVLLFSSLDNLINAEKNFVEKLKVIKKAFLDKMFVKVEV